LPLTSTLYFITLNFLLQHAVGLSPQKVVEITGNRFCAGKNKVKFSKGGDDIYLVGARGGRGKLSNEAAGRVRD